VPNFAKIGQSFAIILRFFVIFQDGGRCHLGFSKIRNFNGLSPVWPICIIMPDFIKIGQTVAEIWRFNVFLNGGRPPCWICRARIGTTHEDYLVVFVGVLNLVGIAAVLWMI